MARSLATVQRIKAIEPIPGKDKIVLISFYGVGFKVIAGADSKVNDLVVYCEYDSLLPIKPEFEFLRSRCYSKTYGRFRIRCMKMGDVFSEGISFPLSILPKDDWEEGDDVTKILDIIKYDPEALEEAKVNKDTHKSFIWKLLYRIPFIRMLLTPKNRKWPAWAKKSDETRVQNLSYLFDNRAPKHVVYTEKLDGQSALYGWYKREFFICSRNLRISTPKGKYKNQQNNYIKVAQMFDIKNKLKRAKKIFGNSFYVQGEICGPSIQGNKYGFKDLRFFVYSVYDITHKCYLGYNDMMNFCTELGFETVPFIEATTLYFDGSSIDRLIEYSKGDSVFAPIPREGIVVKANKYEQPEPGMSNMFSFKCINPDFLVRYPR